MWRASSGMVLLASRIGVRGQEDLGDGYRASFVLEAGLDGDKGAQPDSNRLFNRQAWVGLSGAPRDGRLVEFHTGVDPVRAAGRETRSDDSQRDWVYSSSLRYRCAGLCSFSLGWAAFHDQLHGAGHGDARQWSAMAQQRLSTRTTLYAALAHLCQYGQRNSFPLLGAGVVAPDAQINPLAAARRQPARRAAGHPSCFLIILTSLFSRSKMKILVAIRKEF